ncbi:MAG: hypothetical protein AVDCRST_MAG90-1125 [uncultured Microvirga sp.]|uniref:Uncharacterized protein n=1 Tax=uncultured Microvirga sp. TaxID=412392 RepID=A0A6J4L5R7_9HYPH|nr:MAG: hypothetical protein AVDCRST_MAG90-1125 [uncultured Microvirga sp.]
MLGSGHDDETSLRDSIVAPAPLPLRGRSAPSGATRARAEP